MLWSPHVCVFRRNTGELLETPFSAAVCTAAAPNRNGFAVLTPKSKIGEVMLRRIRIMLRQAVLTGQKSLVLGAWGCGAFRNDPVLVAGYFKEALSGDGLQAFFDHICFAVYGNPEGKNSRAFKDVFGA